MAELDFSVQLRLLNEQFNRGVNQAKNQFGQLQQSINRNVEQLVSDTERADQALSDLNNASADRLTAEIRSAADQLRQMGAGANLSGEQVEQALRTAAQQVGRLDQQLVNARLAATRLGNTDASPEEIEQATAKVARLEQELNEAKSASTSLSNELSGALNRAGNTADSARNSIYRMANVRVPETIRAEIDQISRSLTNFQQNSGRPAAEIERVTRQAQAQIQRLEQELRGADNQIQRTDASTKKLSGGVNKLQGAFGNLQGMLAAVGFGFGAAEIVQMADAFVLLEARIKIATGEGIAFISGFEGVKQIANDTYSSFENTGELFARITQASTSLGLAQTEILSVTKTINEAIKLSGGSAASADAAIIQLVQGLQSGVVRGEEFNSIMEQSPRLAQAMADGLGVTRGELRKMAGEGKLTSEVVIDAVRSQTQVIQKEFKTLPLTFGNSLILMKNTLFEFIGGINETVNQSGRLASGVQSISNAIKDLDPETIAAIELAFDVLLTTFVDMFKAIKDVYNAIGDVTNAVSGIVEADEQIGQFTRTMQNLSVALGVLSDGFKGISILANSVLGSISQITGGILEGYAALKGQTSERATELYALADELRKKSEQQMIDFESSSARAWEQVNKTAKDRLADTAAATQQRYNEMVAAGSYAADALQEQYVKVAQAKIAANDMVITDDMRLELAQQELRASVNETGEVLIESAKGVQAAYLGVGESFAEVAAKGIAAGKSVADSLSEVIPKTQTIGAVDDIINSLTALSNQGLITGQEVAAGINVANQRYQEIEANFARYAAKSIAENKGIVTSELEKAAALQGLAITASDAGEIIVTQLDRTTVASGRTKDQIDELANSVGVGLSKDYAKAKTSVDSIVDGFKDLTDAGYNAGEALFGALSKVTAKASNTTEIDNIILMWRDLGEQGKLTGEDLAAGLDLANERLDALTDGVNSVNEAYKLLGLTTRAEAVKQAEAYTQAYGIIKTDGEATAGQLIDGFKKYAKAAVAANGDVVSSQLKTEAAQRGLTVAVDETGRVTFKSADEAEQSNYRVRRSVESVSSAYSGLSSGASSAGNAMARAAQQAMSEYDKLQAKIEKVKEAQALASADETLKNLRTYGTEKAPTEGNQFGSKTAVENFLKSAGLSQSQAMEEARKLYARAGGNGQIDWAQLNGFSEGQRLNTDDLDNFKSPSAYLAELAEKIRYQDSGRVGGLSPSALQGMNNQPATKRYDIVIGSNTTNVSVPESQAQNFENFMRQLAESRAISGQ